MPSTRLYAKGRVTGQQRGKRNVRTSTNLVQIEGVANQQEAQFYLGKRIAYVYTAQKEVAGSKVRIIWGKVTRPHGASGMVRAKFRQNLPPKAFGHSVRIMLYPSNSLYAKGRVTGQQRGKRKVRTSTNPVQIEGVAN